jgi:hypothetical protein
MMYGHEKSDPAHSSWEADEQSGAIRCGVGGAKGGDQGECAPTRHVLDTQSRLSVPHGVGSHTATYCRQHPRWEPYAGKPHVRSCAGGAR